MSREYNGIERRSDAAVIDRLVSQIGNLHEDVAEIKTAMKELASAITKLALVEERQSHANLAQERVFAAVAVLEKRVAVIERDNVLNSTASKWIFGGLGAAIAAGITWVFGRH